MKKLFVHPISHPFKPGDSVVDKTAEANGWSDYYGKVLSVDGSHVKVKYTSGNVRWKMHISLRKVKDPDNESWELFEEHYNSPRS